MDWSKYYPANYSAITEADIEMIREKRKLAPVDKDAVKQDWKDRSELPFELGAENVIYVLADTEHKFLYVGEAKNLVKRLSKRYSVIPHWNMYRYDVLPKSLGPFRVTLERMLIRSFATLFESKKGHSSLNITGWKLANEKIDK